MRAQGFLAFFAQEVSHQLASILITFHPDVAQAWPKLRLTTLCTIHKAPI